MITKEIIWEDNINKITIIIEITTKTGIITNHLDKIIIIITIIKMTITINKIHKISVKGLEIMDNHNKINNPTVVINKITKIIIKEVSETLNNLNLSVIG